MAHERLAAVDHSVTLGPETHPGDASVRRARLASGMTVSDGEPAELSALLADHDDEVAASTRRLRAAILAGRPELAEKVYRGWHGLGFHHPELGYVAALFPHEQDVQVGFEHGANLPDPHGMLSGTGRQVRYLIFTPGAATPSVEDVVEYLDLALGT